MKLFTLQRGGFQAIRGHRTVRPRTREPASAKALGEEPTHRRLAHFPFVLSCWLYQNEIKRRQGVLPLEWHWRLKQSGRFLFPISATNPTLGRQKCRLPC